MEGVLVFDKSYQERLQEYNDIFCNRTVSLSDVRDIWSFYLECMMDPAGWQAIWKIPRLKCERLSISFPTIVLVYVELIDYKKIEALVKVLAVQDEKVSIPDKHSVPLMQLWLTKEQDDTVVLNLNRTANCLDMYRFFYNNVFLPWDTDEEDSKWISKYLESRLRLFYDIKNGVIPKHVSVHIISILAEAKRCQARKELLESELENENLDVNDDNTKDERVSRLIKQNVRIIQIRNELELLENPLTRAVVMEEQAVQRSNNSEPANWLIYEAGKCAEYHEIAENIKNRFGDVSFRCLFPLSHVLETCNFNDTIILSKGKHRINSMNRFEKEGLLVGISNRNEAVITSENEDMVMDFSGDVTIENLTIEAKFAQCGILVRSGRVLLKNCVLIGTKRSSISQGIIVLQSGSLELTDCDVSGFSTGITANSKSSITLNDSVIHNVDFGVKIYDNCKVFAKTTTFKSCREYGFHFETDQSVNKTDSNSFDVLKTYVFS